MLLSKKFIAANYDVADFTNVVPAPYLRKTFNLDFTPESAGITICGLGFYELYINGVNITKGALAPYISNPDDICYYDNYDVKSYLKTGKNAIGVVLGNGFRNSFGGFVWDFEKADCRGAVCLALSFEAKSGDKTITFEADESFKTHPSPIKRNDVRMGTLYDARDEIAGWNLPDFDDSSWQNAVKITMPKGERKLCTVEPIKVYKVLKPVSVKFYDEIPLSYKTPESGAEPFPESFRKNVYVYDFGLNSAGVSRLKIKGKRGQKITIHHGEYLQDGKFSLFTTMFAWHKDYKLYLDYGQCDEYVLKGDGEEVFTPTFKYDGFRYLCVEGLTPEQATLDAFEFLVMSSSLKTRADFECSDVTLNTLYKMAVNSDKSNFYYFPTDCPHREKNGWTGDASMSCEHMLLHLQGEKSLEEWLNNIRKAQKESGQIPGIVPTGGWGYSWGNGPVWDSVLFTLPLEIYRRTGDKKVINDNLEAMLRWLSYAGTKRDDKGLLAFGLGDWVDPNEGVNGKIAAPLELTDTVMTYLNAEIAEFLFGEVGRTLEKHFAAEFKAELKKAIRNNLIDFDTMTAAGDCQTSQAFTIFAKIFSDSEMPAAKRRLLEIIHRDNDINACGMVGLRCIFRTLCDMGEGDLAYKMIAYDGYSGYASWIKAGATALCEQFFFFTGRGAGSQNHHFLGDILALFIEKFAGLNPNPYYNDKNYLLVTPNFISALNYAKASFDFDSGKSYVSWERAGNKISLKITVPEGVRAELILPQGYALIEKTAKLIAGENEFTVVKIQN